MFKKTCSVVMLLVAFTTVGTAQLADPNWTAQYQTSQTPEGNGFTRAHYGEPAATVNTVTGGNPAQRRIELTTTVGNGVAFLTSSVPSLNSSVGATIQFTCSVSGVGNAGAELTFLNHFFGVQVYANRMTVIVNDGQGPHEFASGLSNTSDTIVRMTIAPDRRLNIYRNATLVDTRIIPEYTSPFQRVLFWGEDGGTQIFRTMMYYLGGPVA